MRRFASALLLVLLLPWQAGAGAPDFEIRIDGKVLRKASGKLVFSLSEFELDGATEVAIANRRTGESRTVRLSSVYADSSYSDELPAGLFDAIEPGEWSACVTWRVPDSLPAMTARLAAIHEYQNVLRLGLGRTLLDEKEPGSKVSSRIALNKIEKFHRIGASLAGRIRAKGTGDDEVNPFRRPIRIQSGFNPFSMASSASLRTPVEQIREVLFWEAHRTLTQQMGVPEDLVDLVFDAPATVRRFTPLGEGGGGSAGDFAPTVVIAAESIDAAAYIARQRIGADIRKLVRLKMFRDDFIRDRRAVDLLVNEGQVVAMDGRRLAVSFAPPFVKDGETVSVIVDGEAGGEIPVVLAVPKADEGYTLTAEIPDGAIARVRPGMTVRRK